MMESLYHRHRQHRHRRRHQNHGFFKGKSFRVAHYEMQAVIGLSIIKLVVPRIIVLSAANFETKLLSFVSRLFHLLRSHSYIFMLHLYLSFFCDTKIYFVVW